MTTDAKQLSLALTAEELERLLRQRGYLPGVPAHIDERTRAIDAAACRSMKCPNCRKRRMIYRPFTNGRHYAVIAACRCCGAGEPV